MLNNNDDSLVVITGASSGIGNVLAKILASKKKKILAIGRNIEGLQQLKMLYPSEITTVSADISQKSGRDSVINAIPKGSCIFALVNNAAVMSPSGCLANIELEEWRYQIAVNLEAPLFLTQQLLPLLDNGRILNLTIYSSFKVRLGLAAYAISKAALNMMTQYYQAELQAKKIAVASVLPGIVDTPIQKQLPPQLLGTADVVDLVPKRLSPKISATFLAWLLLETSAQQFSEKTWDIYDTTHQDYWVNGFPAPQIS